MKRRFFLRSLALIAGGSTVSLFPSPAPAPTLDELHAHAVKMAREDWDHYIHITNRDPSPFVSDDIMPDHWFWMNVRNNKTFHRWHGRWLNIHG